MTETKKDMSKYLTPIAILVSGVILAVAIYFTPTTTKAPTNTANTAGTGTQRGTTKADISKVTTENEPYIGDANAKVVLAYWSDYQCPFCKQFELSTLPTIINNYVKNNKVKVVFKDYSFLGPNSTTAALYERAVWEAFPQKYFEWRTAMYQAQDAENAGFGDEASILKLTKTISGIDATRVQKLVNEKSATYQKQLDAARTEGTAMGVSGTPGFVTGTQLISGAGQYAQFTAALDAQLK